MNAKLFVAMGVPWAVDVISDFIMEPRWVWYVPEALLSLQGVFIFCIFVLKRKVLVRVRKRLSSLCARCCCCCPCCDGDGGSSDTEARGATTGACANSLRQPLTPSAAAAAAAAAAGANARHVHKSASSSTLCTVTASELQSPGLLRLSPSPTRARAER
ncbi:hypothetical protein R5R35_001105 [Gryllus longicercus]|uniref:Uncharacterized protein n=1 Tax=Gryllus longicercus TaxID=2509291 RepID=A0AAN9VR52_9ORTH